MICSKRYDRVMKNQEKKTKDFDTVKVFREIKEKISADIKEMDFEQLTAYLNKTKLKPQNNPISGS